MSEVPTRLLRETLRSRTTPAASSACIDAETLAAWSGGTLSARERAAAESHASSCLRCQALLAAMARLETSAPPTPARRWWHASTIGWLVPVAVAAAAVLVWINVPGGRPARSTASARASSADSSTVRKPLPSADRPAESKDAERAPQRTAKADAPRARTATGAAQSFARRAEQATAARGSMRGAAVAPSSPTTSPAAVPLSPNAATETTTTTSTADAPPAAASKPPSVARATTDQAMFRTGVMAKASAVPTVIMSPDANVRWRIVRGSVGVERSIDGGLTWEPQSTGVPATLTAGTAPSPTICWLVGAGGIVVLSTDGRTWQRVQFPEAIDLSSIRASDAANATVTAIDGRTFITVDGGNTWRAR